MKELSKVKGLNATRTAVTTMALWKDSLVKSLRLMEIRLRAQEKIIHAMEVSSKVDQTIAEVLKDGRDYDIVFNDKAN